MLEVGMESNGCTEQGLLISSGEAISSEMVLEDCDWMNSWGISKVKLVGKIRKRI